MSVNAIERLLWKASADPGSARRFREDSSGYLADFNLDDGEWNMLGRWDVAGLVSHGVNPLLVLMSFNAVKGFGRTEDYLKMINTPDPAEGNAHKEQS